MVSEEEKRRILRERRAAKIKNSSERLGKITGERPGFEKEQTQTNTSSSTAPSTRSNSSRITRSAAASRRISQTFEHHDDPEIEDIDSLQNTMIQEEKEAKEEAKEFQKALQQYLQSEQHKHDDSNNQSDPTMDLFNKLMSVSGAGPDLGSPFGEGAQQQTQEPVQSMEEIEYQQKLIEFNKQENDKFKARFLLLKLITFMSLTLYSFFVEGYHSSFSSTIRYQYNSNTSNFFQIFTTLEVLFTSFYAYRISNLKDNEYNYSFSKILEYLHFIPEQFLPQVWRNRIRLIIKYFDLLQLILFDFAVIFVVFGFLSFLH